MQLFTYPEIQEIEQLENGADFRFVQIPEYLFTWQPKQEHVNVWVTNNVGIRSMSPEYSFYQFCDKLELSKQEAEMYDASDIANLIGMFAMTIMEYKNDNALPERYKFKI